MVWRMKMTKSDVATLSRAERQEVVSGWCARTFGAQSQKDRKKRALRFLEEAIELYQAEGCDFEQAQALLAHLFSRPPGDPRQEVGGVSVTLLSYCAAADLSADECEAAEIVRVLNKSPEQARQRYHEKTKAGF